MSDDKQPSLTLLVANQLTPHVPHMERPQPREMLEHVKWNLAVLDEELAPHLKRRIELLQQVATLEEVMHPIRRIFDDLLQEIFLFCLPDEYTPNVSPSEAPLLITQVCSEWRQLALATPQLWASVHLPVFPNDYELECGPISLIHRWFQAARQVPMDISLCSASNYLVNKSPITTCVTSHSFHIRTLELTGSAQLLAHFHTRGIAPAHAAVDSQDHPDLSGSSDSLVTVWPVLEKLAITLVKAYSSSRAPPTVPDARLDPGKQISNALFWSAPRLNSISLSALEDHLLSLPLQWNHMEHIEVHHSASWDRSRQDEVAPSTFTQEEARRVLQKCRKLTTLNMTLSDHPDKHLPDHEAATIIPQAASSVPLTHGYLTDLHLVDIVAIPGNNAGTFLQNLQLPALKTLAYFLAPPSQGLSAAHMPTTFDYPLYRFLNRQTCPIAITSLDISLRSIPAPALIECLKLLPLLEELRLGLQGPTLGLQHSSYSDNVFLNMLLPLGMRFNVEGSGKTPSPPSSSPQPPLLDIPEAGLCPLLHHLHVQAAMFTSEDVLRLVNCRITLNQAQPTRYSRMRRFYALFMGEYRPDFVARDARGATSPIEEMLWDLGVEGALILRMDSGFYGKLPPRVSQKGWKAGLPLTISSRWESPYFFFG